MWLDSDLLLFFLCLVWVLFLRSAFLQVTDITALYIFPMAISNVKNTGLPTYLTFPVTFLSYRMFEGHHLLSFPC